MTSILSTLRYRSFVVPSTDQSPFSPCANWYTEGSRDVPVTRVLESSWLTVSAF